MWIFLHFSFSCSLESRAIQMLGDELWHGSKAILAYIPCGTSCSPADREWIQWVHPDLLCGHGEICAAAALDRVMEIQQPQVVSQMQVSGQALCDRGRKWVVTEHQP